MHEIGRLQTSGNAVIDALTHSIELNICELSHLQVISAAVQQTWTPDPFDRVIVGQAAVNQRTLVTKEVLIRTHYPQAFWSLATGAP